MKRFSRLFAILIAAATPVLPATADTAADKRLCPLQGVQQLRIYEIFDSNKPAFHARFRDHAQRIMNRHGFTIIAIWETKQSDRTEFVYLLQWPDEETMKRRWDLFMADEEWSQIKRKTGAQQGRLVGEIENRILKRTSYSPC